MTIVTRIHGKKEVDGVFSIAHTLADILLTMPRLVSKQTARSNGAANSPSKYFTTVDSTNTSSTYAITPSHQLIVLILIALIPSHQLIVLILVALLPSH